MAGETIQTDSIKTLSKVVIFLLLLGVFLYILTFSGTIKCKTIPFWCQSYYAIKGNPKVAIVYGDEGLGDPILLQQLFSSPDFAGVKPILISVDTVSVGNLRDYDLVIVEKARNITTEQIEMFIEYANAGGNLVWTGDAGANVLNEDEYLFEDELIESGEHTKLGPWSRKLSGSVVLLDETLSLQYKENYCNVGNQTACVEEQENCLGKLTAVDNEHPLTLALRSDLPLCFFGNNGPALTESTNSKQGKTLVSLDTGSNVTVDEEKLGRTFPIVVAVSNLNFLGINIGENVFYYALPPEMFSDPRLAPEHQYDSFTSNLYFGILFG